MASTTIDLLHASHFQRYELRNVVLSPRLWSAYRYKVKLNWQRVPFHQNQAGNLPDDEKGVYLFVVHLPARCATNPGLAYLCYVGMTESGFRSRFRSYLREPSLPKPRPKIKRMIGNWKKYLWYYYAPIRHANLNLTNLEDNLIECLQPPHNDKFPMSISAQRKEAFE